MDWRRLASVVHAAIAMQPIANNNLHAPRNDVTFTACSSIAARGRQRSAPMMATMATTMTNPVTLFVCVCVCINHGTACDSANRSHHFESGTHDESRTITVHDLRAAFLAGTLSAQNKHTLTAIGHGTPSSVIDARYVVYICHPQRRACVFATRAKAKRPLLCVKVHTARRRANTQSVHVLACEYMYIHRRRQQTTTPTQLLNGCASK